MFTLRNRLYGASGNLLPEKVFIYVCQLGNLLMIKLNQLKSFLGTKALRSVAHTKPADFAKLKPSGFKYLKPLAKDTVVINKVQQLVTRNEALELLKKPEFKGFEKDIYLLLSEIVSPNGKSLHNLDELNRLISNTNLLQSLGYKNHEIYEAMALKKPMLEFVTTLVKEKNFKPQSAKNLLEFCTDTSKKLDGELLKTANWVVNNGYKQAPSQLLINKAGNVNKETLKAYYRLDSLVGCSDEMLMRSRDIRGNINPKILEKLENSFNGGAGPIDLLLFSQNFKLNKVDETQFNKAFKLLRNKLGNQSEYFVKNLANSEKGFNKQDFEAVNKIVSKYNDPKQITHAIDFKEFMGQSVENLTGGQKRDFLDKILSAQYNKRLNISLGEEFAIIPKTELETASLIQKLIKETTVSKTATLPKTDFFSTAILEKFKTNPSYKNLSDKDKKILEIVSLYKGKPDCAQKAYDAFYLSEKAGFSLEERNKIYSLIKNQNAIQEIVHGGKLACDTAELAAELRHGNSLELLTFMNRAEVPSLKNNKSYCETVHELKRNLSKINRYKITLPQSSIPKANSFIVDGEVVKEIEVDGIKNIVVYTSKNKPAKYLDDKGVQREFKSEDMVNFYHAMSGKKAALDVLALASRPDNKQLLSATYKSPSVANNKFFDSKGLIFNVPDYNIYLSSNRPIESGFGKIKNHSCFYNKENRFDKYELIKAYEKHSAGGKSLESLYEQNPEAKKEIKEAITNIAKLQSTYDEALISAPEIQAIFAADRAESFKKVMLEKLSDLPKDLRTFASENNLPVLWMLP